MRTIRQVGSLSYNHLVISTIGGNVIPLVNRSPERSEGECEESFRSTLLVGTRISQSLRSFEMTLFLLQDGIGRSQVLQKM
jgi:hypothetical protein